MDFGTAEIYLSKYDVLKSWITAAVVGGLVPIAAFVTALIWWLKCKHLWKRDRVDGIQLQDYHAGMMAWLRQ